MKERFASIVDRHHSSVYRLAYRFTGRQKDAEDLTQETFLKAYEHLLNHEEKAKDMKWKAWLLTICTNLVRKQAKRRWDLPFSELEKTDEMQIEVEDEQLRPDELAELEDEQSRVRVAIEALPQKYKVVLQLRYMEGLKYKEIAETLGIKINNVKVQITRAKAQLKSLL